jgi:hypothetical protein
MDFLDGIAALIAKSLVSAGPRARSAQYRLLETTRAYALEKLTDTAEQDSALRRHAEYFRALMHQAEIDRPIVPEQEWHREYAHAISDVRAAIDWLLVREGEEAQGVNLTGLGAPLWFALGLLEEYRGLAARALEVMRGCAGDFSAIEMRLNTWLGAATLGTLGPVAQMETAYACAFAIATTLEVADYQLYALWGLAAYHYTQGNYTEYLWACQRYDEVTEKLGDLPGRIVRDRIMSSALCFVGQLTEARIFGERALQTPAIQSRSSGKSFFQLDHHLGARLHLPRILWLQGFPDRAAVLVREAVEKAQSPYYSFPLCWLLAFAACPIALWSGDTAGSGHYLRVLGSQTANRGETYLALWEKCFVATMELGVDDGSPAFRETVMTVRHLAPQPVYSEMMATIREELCSCTVFERALAGPASWCTPEILRAHAASIVTAGKPDGLVHAENLLGRSLAMAREQGALAWQLRTAITLARLYQNSHREPEARSVLAPLYASFSEGFGTADLRTARTVLETL